MLIALLTLFLLAEKSETAANGNAAEYKALCDLIRLAEAADKVSEAAQTDKGAAAYEELLNLNNSAADEGWRKDKNGQLAGKEGDSKDTERQQWRQQIAKLGEKVAGTENFKYTSLTKQRRRPGVAKAISRLLTHADALKAAMQQAEKQIETEIATAKTELTNALYGDGKTAFDGKGLSATATATCTASDDAAAGLSLTTDLLCLCIGVENAGLKNCKQTANSATAASWTTHATVKIEGEKAIGACATAPPDLTPSPANLQAAIGTFTALIGRQAGKATTGDGTAIFGRPHTAGECNGSSDQGMCVNYKHYLKGGALIIPWLNKIDKAIMALNAAKQQKAKAEATSRELESLAVNAWTLFDDVLYEKADDTAVATGKTAAPTEAAEAKEKECNTKGKDNEESCKKLAKDGCVFNPKKDDGKKCTWREEGKQGAQQAAEKTAGTDSKNESKCGDKKTEGDCKDGCKWDGKECKDYSILVNNQFALSVVSAAFAALLF
uniref:Variant surface glycoprotein 1125.277 n=1 Tax=Trypanosoma brucei TaxID=5691 RepID=A0A1J0R5K6_9TRYP|nr:variant surface glycoprotein 1125.277 [Trypanosoma brucei]